MRRGAKAATPEKMDMGPEDYAPLEDDVAKKNTVWFSGSMWVSEPGLKQKDMTQVVVVVVVVAAAAAAAWC